MILVLDASVIVHALLPDASDPLAARAEALWTLAATDVRHVLEPPHWLPEVTGVLARMSPSTAAADTRDLHAMQLPIDGRADVHVRAVEMAVELEHHVFDTLYHAVALRADSGLLVTADDRYYRKAERLGRIARLGEFTLDMLELDH